MAWHRQLLRRALTGVCPRRLFVTRGPRGREVCLTFDDGPHPEHTPRLLDVLKRERVRANFFVIGREAVRYPDLLKRIVDDGHELGHHSFEHRDPEATTAPQLLEEVRQTDAVFASAIGRSARLVRPPHGKVTGSKLWALWRHGYAVALWNVDPKDFSCRSTDELRGRLTNIALQGGDIVLFHDNHPHAAEILPELIRRTRASRLEFCRLSGWTGGREAGAL
jgi:peptidoglycan/xylan/chitin deacetylase (PgdA/CDA1 family)